MAAARLEMGGDPERAAAWQAFLRAARAATERLARDERQGPPPVTGRPTTAHGTATFRCGATARVDYPAGAAAALSRFRRALRHRECPGCAAGAHAPWWRVAVRSAHPTRWWWRELTVRREARG